MIYIAIICACVMGVFETVIFRLNHQEEDLYIFVMSYIVAGFLLAVKLAGAW